MFRFERQQQQDTVKKLRDRDPAVAAAYDTLASVLGNPDAPDHKKQLDKARWDFAGALAEAGVGLERYTMVNTAAAMIGGQCAYRS